MKFRLTLSFIARFYERGQKKMDFYMKLPRSKKEFALFMLVISVISVNIIAPIITCFEMGFSLTTWRYTLEVIPLVWLCVIAVVLITYKPASVLTNMILRREDSFNAHVLANILFSVLLMSVILTVLGSWIGERNISMEPITMFFYKWPRNFAVSLGVETCIAQPIARFVMRKYHEKADAKKDAESRERV